MSCAASASLLPFLTKLQQEIHKFTRDSANLLPFLNEKLAYEALLFLKNIGQVLFF